MRAVFLNAVRNRLAWVPFDARHEWCPIDRHEIRRQNVVCLINYIAAHVSDAGPRSSPMIPTKVACSGCGRSWIMASADATLPRG